MYAYVKLISSGKLSTVGINQIKNYKPNRPNKVFEVKIKGEYHKCLIGFTNESAQFDKDKHDAQMKQFYSYLSSKITDTRAGVKRLPKVKPVESSDTEDSSDIEEDTIVSDGEEDSGESTDEDMGYRNSNPESDNTVIQESKDEVGKTDFEHELEPTVAVSNAAERKLNEEQEKESEPNNSSTQNEEEEKNHRLRLEKL